MEFAGGLMIMAVLLGLLCAAVWLSLPVLLISLRNRLVESGTTLEGLSQRIAALEKHVRQLVPPSPPSPPDQAVHTSDREELDGSA